MFGLPHAVDGYYISFGDYRLCDCWRPAPASAFFTLAGFLGYSYGLMLYRSLPKVLAMAAMGAAPGNSDQCPAGLPDRHHRYAVTEPRWTWRVTKTSSGWYAGLFIGMLLFLAGKLQRDNWDGLDKADVLTEPDELRHQRRIHGQFGLVSLSPPALYSITKHR